jgi:hypothetical protein
MNESLTKHAKPDTLSEDLGASRATDGSSLEKTWTAVGENALLAGQLDQPNVSRLSQLESWTQAIEVALAGFLGRIKKLLRDLDGRIEGLTERIIAAHFSGDRIVTQVGNDLWLTKVLNRFLMFVQSSEFVAPILVIDGYWEKVITEAFVGRFKPGLTVVDVGANYGYYSLLSAATVGTSTVSMPLTQSAHTRSPDEELPYALVRFHRTSTAPGRLEFKEESRTPRFKQFSRGLEPVCTGAGAWGGSPA